MKSNDSLQRALLTAAEALRPPGSEPLVSWAAKHFRLSNESSAQTGEFRPLPYQLEPLELMHPNSPYEEVCLQWASQLSKTTLTLVFLAYIIKEDPAPVLVVQPNLQMSEVWSKQRLSPMLRDMPVLHGIVADPKSRDSGSTVFSRSFRGGHVSVASAGSPAGLASRPIRYLILDETDRFEKSSGAEGSPSSLAIARTRTYRASRKILWTSSPTLAGESEINAVYEESDQREYEVPCPHCSGFQSLKWDNVEWPPGDPLAAFYRCALCSEAIQEHQKTAMVAAGRWTARNPGAAIAGFHLSELVSPFRTWGELAVDFEKATANPEKLRAFWNTSLAECWSDEQQNGATEAELLQRVENFGPMVPEAAAIIVAGVDIQADRAEVSVVAYGRGEESWLLTHRVIPGDPTGSQLWASLDAFLMETYVHPVLGPLSVHAACVDSGFLAETVTRFCDQRKSRRIWAVKGMPGTGRKIWPPKQSKALKGRVYVIGVDGAKRILYQRLKITEAGPGRIHHPVACSPRYFEQLCSEYEATTYKKGRPERAWVRRQGRAAEALDAWNYAYAALMGLAAHGITADAEVDRMELVRESRGPSVSGNPFQMNRSRFLAGNSGMGMKWQ